MKKRAICIGNNEYKSYPSLKYCLNDARAIGQKLEECGFIVQIEENIDLANLTYIEDSIDNIINDCDVFVLYYAGHGMQVEGENLLILTDCDCNGTNNAKKRFSYKLSDLFEKLNSNSDLIKIIILDACRISGRGGGSFGFTSVNAPQNTIVAFSTSPNQSSIELDEYQHGFYTEVLLDFIDFPREPIETVFKKVRQRMIALRGTTQIPWEHSSLVKEFYFNTDTAFDAAIYSDTALCDSSFILNEHSELHTILEKIRYHDFYVQNDGIGLLRMHNFKDNVSKDELFVLGRSILAAAEGNSWQAQYFIESFDDISISEQIKIHILNGILYEIFFDSSNNIRNVFKHRFVDLIYKFIRKAEYVECRSFIQRVLFPFDSIFVVVPGTVDNIYIDVVINDDNGVLKLKNIFYNGNRVILDEEYVQEVTIEKLKEQISDAICYPTTMFKLHFNRRINRDLKIIAPIINQLKFN